MRVCSQPGCPTLVPKAGRCPEHSRAHETARGSRHQRGYGASHTRERAQWEPKVKLGIVTCWRCHELIGLNEPWDLGHDDVDRTQYMGPEHANRCNRAAGGRKSHANR